MIIASEELRPAVVRHGIVAVLAGLALIVPVDARAFSPDPSPGPAPDPFPAAQPAAPRVVTVVQETPAPALPAPALPAPARPVTLAPQRVRRAPPRAATPKHRQRSRRHPVVRQRPAAVFRIPDHRPPLFVATPALPSTRSTHVSRLLALTVAALTLLSALFVRRAAREVTA